MDRLWNREVERKFFLESLAFATPEQLFYITDSNRYLAYWPKGYKGSKTTLQSRNSIIGSFTERWTRDLIADYLADKGLYAVQGAVCDEISLPNNSPGDVVISKTNRINQRVDDIIAIIEVKMSVVWNWEFIAAKSEITLTPIGDYKSHQGNPGLLRSDTMLKAIGKSINIRVSNIKASSIPIIIMGNTPITNNYYAKVDYLRSSGIVQGFWSINPRPLDVNDNDNIKQTPKKGFYRFDTFKELKENIDYLLSEERNFFSSMKSKAELGKIIEVANCETTYEKKGGKFLELIKG